MRLCVLPPSLSHPPSSVEEAPWVSGQWPPWGQTRFYCTQRRPWARVLVHAAMPSLAHGAVWDIARAAMAQVIPPHAQPCPVLSKRQKTSLWFQAQVTKALGGPGEQDSTSL